MDAKHSVLTAGRRELTKAQNRETILLAARRVFSGTGFCHRHGQRHHPRHAPWRRGTFYNYFKSKEEVYLGFLRDQEALALRPKLRQARRAAATPAEFLANSFRAFFWFVAESQDPPDRFRMDSPEVLAGFAELREDLESAQAKGLFPAVDSGQLSAALTGVAFELAEQVKAGAEVEEATAFATALFMGGLNALPKRRTI